MRSGEGIETDMNAKSDGQTTLATDERGIELAWLQVRLCWPQGGKSRLDDEKKDAIATLIRHYSESQKPDRPLLEFQQVLLRLEEELALRLRELSREQRRAIKGQNNPIQVVRDNTAAWLKMCRERTEEPPPIIVEWKQLINLLFGLTAEET
jgi:hypothetical protein